MEDNKEPREAITHEEAIREIWEKLNELIEKVNSMAKFLEDVFGKPKEK